MWRKFDLHTMPTSGQVLVTDADAEDGEPYGDMDLICLPITGDGRTLSQITGNYSRKDAWTWWMPAPSKLFEKGAGAMAGNVSDTIAVIPVDIDDWHRAKRGSRWLVVEQLADGTRVVLNEVEDEEAATAYALAITAT
jgi:hypothetical protein